MIFSIGARLLIATALLAPTHHACAQATAISLPTAITAGQAAGAAAAQPYVEQVRAAVATGNAPAAAAAATAAIKAAAVAAKAAAAAQMAGSSLSGGSNK